jgi:hypothetical protein
MEASELSLKTKWSIDHSQMKKLIFLSLLAGILISLNSCKTTGYVASEPDYVEFVRPARPSELHIWIDGEWQYSRSQQAYIQKKGYWKKPNEGRIFVKGQWIETSRGRTWVPGHWQKRGR